MSRRLDVFNSFEKHPMLGRDLARLTKAERAECECFIVEHDELSPGEFGNLVQKWKIDSPQSRSKNYTIMWALLMQSNVTIQKRK